MSRAIVIGEMVNFGNRIITTAVHCQLTALNGDAEIAGLDIAGLDISGRVCESELGNILSK